MRVIVTDAVVRSLTWVCKENDPEQVLSEPIPLALNLNTFVP